MAPNLGQGANSALVDAVLLADQLAGGGSVPAALAAYDRLRRPAVRRIQDGAGMLQRLCGLGPGPGRLIRDVAFVPWGARAAGPTAAFGARCCPTSVPPGPADVDAQA